MASIAGSNFFQREDVMVVLTTCPAGLGHTRVTEALHSGLPEGVRAELLGIEDRKIQLLHSTTSRNRALRRVMEFFQRNPLAEDVFTTVYRKYLRSEGNEVFEKVSDLVLRRRPKPSVLLVISTHFGLAHKIAAVKSKLAKELKLCVMLCVVDTDDSPQKIWAVSGADYVFVPSEVTKKALELYFSKLGGTKPKLVVSAYPISPNYSKRLTDDEYEFKLAQVRPAGKEKMNLLIPISGAAVQLSYFRDMIVYLDRKRTARMMVVSRDSKYTSEFIRWCQGVYRVEVVADKLDREVVASYEAEIKRDVYALEVTKPSEQSFKALVSPKKRGGVILLFSEPVGRQEYDNLAFMQRHGLIPDNKDRETLSKLFYLNGKDGLDREFLERARSWRGVLLPKEGKVAGKAIERLRKTGVLRAMAEFSGYKKSRELKGDGVRRFWRRLAKESHIQCSFLA